MHTRTLACPRTADDGTICSAEVASLVAEEGRGEEGGGGGREVKGSEGKGEQRRSLDFSPLKLNNICELCVGQRPFALLNDLNRTFGQRRFGGPEGRWRRGGGAPLLGAGELTVKVNHTLGRGRSPAPTVRQASNMPALKGNH